MGGLQGNGHFPDDKADDDEQSDADHGPGHDARGRGPVAAAAANDVTEQAVVAAGRVGVVRVLAAVRLFHLAKVVMDSAPSPGKSYC